jgi:suppressor of G2 allele of SKP1
LERGANNACQSLKYPSSARKLVSEVQIDVAEEELTGEAAINSLFQKIYADASEDTRRAMMKSFFESKGTVLSTNWNEVGDKHIDPVPPK